MPTSIPTSTLEKFTTFGDLLRFLRRRIGITQMELSIAVGYSDAQISRLEQNLRLPDISTIEARFIPALYLENEPEVTTQLLELAANVRREDAPAPGLCPYKGLNYFDEADADLFVGREALTEKMKERVIAMTVNGAQHGIRFLAVIGASGSGKSSLVRAGLIPALRWDKKSADWHIYTITPTTHPLESLALSLSEENESVSVAATLMDDLASDPRSLHLFATRKLGSEKNMCFLVVIDQFEELFALCRSEEERVLFIGNLLRAASEAAGPVVVVITLRADFYAHCANYLDLRQALAQHQEYIGAMGGEELKRAIEEPADRGRWELEPGLVDLLLHDVGTEPGALPLLSHALLETWHRRRGRTLTLSGYTSSGGVHGAIAETAETVFFDQLTKEQQSVARRIFLRLTELGDETSNTDTRRRAKFNELILNPDEAPITQKVLKKLADARLIITSEDSAEVAHEALIREWPTLRGWLEDNREDLRLQRLLTEAAQEWKAMSHLPDMLYRGVRLEQARQGASSHEDEMNALEREFLEASIETSERKAAEREAQRKRELEAARKLAEMEGKRAEEQLHAAKQLRKRALYLAGAFTIALIMAVTALFFGAQARQAAVQAETKTRIATARELAKSAVTNLEFDPQLSILLALEAINTTRSEDGYIMPGAEEALHQAVQSVRTGMTFFDENVPIDIVAYDPSGTRILTWGGEGDDFPGIVKIWDAMTGEPLLSRPGLPVTLFWLEEARITTVKAKEELIVEVWDTTTGEVVTSQNIPVSAPPMYSDFVSPDPALDPMSSDLSPDSTLVAVALQNNTIEIWNLLSNELVTILNENYPSPDHFVVFSPIGDSLASINEDGTIRIWDVSSGNVIHSLESNQGNAHRVKYSPDGNTLVSAGTDSTAKVWDTKSGELLVTLSEHSNGLNDLAINADGSLLATAGWDKVIKVWDLSASIENREGKVLLSLAGHQLAVMSIDFHPFEEHLVSASLDGSIRVWDITPSGGVEGAVFLSGRELPTDFISKFALSPDGHRLVTTNADPSPKVWDTNTGELLFYLLGHDDNTAFIDMSGDGKLVVSTNVGGTTRIWNAVDGELLSTLEGYWCGPCYIALNADGTRLVIGNDFGATFSVLDIGFISSPDPDDNYEELFTISGNPEFGFGGVAFSPDGSQIAASAELFQVKLWDSENGELIHTLVGHEAHVYGVTYGPDGTLLASGGQDGTARLWNVSDGKLLFTLSGHTGSVVSSAFSPDGEILATASMDWSVKLWNVASGQYLYTLYGHSAGVTDVAFSTDGKYLYTASLDGTTRVYLMNIDEVIALGESLLTRSFSDLECQKYLHQNTCP